MVRIGLVCLMPMAVLAQEPVPAERTEAQILAFEDRTAKAKAASEAASAEVLTFFGSAEFRSAMADCCPLAAALSPQELLEAFRAEVQVAELAHAFPAASGQGHFTDVTLDLLKEKSWFLNEWQVGFLDGATSSKATQNAAATSLFGLPASPDTGYTWSEASDRMIYIAENFFQQDTGSSPNFGDVSAIFDTEYVRNMVLIAPVDTGIWHMSGCDQEFGSGKGLVQEVEVDGSAPPGHNVNCSAWDGVVGTLDYHDHLILANFDSRANESKAGSTRLDKAKAFFQRSAFGGSYVNLPEISSNEYWESNIVGNPGLKAVKFLVGNFPELFGTETGRALQEVAGNFSWPLTWALGSGASSGGSSHHSNQSMPGNQRFLDPSTKNTNASFSAGAAAAFEEAWQKAAADRSAGSVSAETVASWWSALSAAQMRLAPVTAQACSDVSGCIGTNTATDDCICRASLVVV